MDHPGFIVSNLMGNSIGTQRVIMGLGLPRLRNLVNVYTSSTNQNNPVYTELLDLIIFMMQIGKIANIFPKKNSLKNVPCANI